MNKLAIISAFLGRQRNRYLLYQEDVPLDKKFERASQLGGVEGLELCYPADFADPAEIKRLLSQYNFAVSAINFRSRREGKWWRGSFVSEIPSERQEVVDELRRAMDFTAELGAFRITTCPLNEGSDTPFEMDYIRGYDYCAETLSAACAHNRQVRICIEYKKNDPIGRCLLGTAGETAAFCMLTGADNLGATLDIGHALFAEERPAQSAALLAKANRLFYVHLNDNDGRADWDLVPGAFHLWEFVEMFYTLRKLGYEDDWYGFDILSKELDIVENLSAGMHLTRKLEEITDRIDSEKMESLMSDRNSSKTIPYLYSLL